MEELIQFKNLRDLEKSLKDEKTCRAFYERVRWEGEVCCPHCGSVKVYTLKANEKNNNYKCADCLKKFNCLTGTIFHGTQLPLIIWFKAMYLVATLSKGISSPDLANALGITVKTSWYLLHRIRQMLKDNAPDLLEGTVEIDSSWIGGKESNKHVSKRSGVKGGLYRKRLTPVLGLLQRDGRLLCRPVAADAGSVVVPIMVAAVKRGSTIYTDSALHLRGLKRHEFKHEAVNHNAGEYVRGKVTTNGIEGAFGLLKRKINGIHHQVSPKHLHRYCIEFTFGYNNRELNSYEKFRTALKGTEGRLLYKELISNRV